MCTLILFDEHLLINKLIEKVKNLSGNIELFPLTSNFIFIEQLQQKLSGYQHNIRLIESAKIINEAVLAMQKNINQWSFDLGEQVIKGKKIKDWFILPDQIGTAWWFGLISEKNSVQSNAFFKIAQCNAIYSYINKNAYAHVIIACAERQQRHILRAISAKHSKVILLKSNIPRSSFKQAIIHFSNASTLMGSLISACLHWVLWVHQAYLARKKLGKINRKQERHLFLFVSYFPNINNEAAEKNIFVNKYTGPLEEKLKSLNIPISWLLMPVNYNGHDYQSALTLAQKFAQNGEKLWILQEFFTLKQACKSFFWWFKQAILSFILWRLLDKKILTQHLTQLECLPIVKNIWQHSFIGTSGIRGILFYLTFCEVFKRMPNMDHCLYYCEMQAWEKALLLAKKKFATETQTLGFQHTTIPRNFFHYFYHPDETKQSNKISDFPLPDKLIANGKIPYRFLAESKFRSLYQAEAIRQLYLKNIVKFPLFTTKKPILLVVGSYDRNETKSLITMIYCAYPKAQPFEIWFKASPINPVAPLFAELNIDIAKTHYKICKQDISSLLPQVSITLIANTTVAIEAAALGLPVIIPLFADTMLMNPILDTKANYFLVSHWKELKILIREKIHGLSKLDLSKPFIDDYWNLNVNLPLWNEILTTSLCQ